MSYLLSAIDRHLRYFQSLRIEIWLKPLIPFSKSKRFRHSELSIRNTIGRIYGNLNRLPIQQWLDFSFYFPRGSMSQFLALLDLFIQFFVFFLRNSAA